GTLVLTSTISKSFDDLFATIDQGTDAVVRAHVVISGGFGSGDQRPNIPETLVDLVRAVPSVKAAEGNVDFNKSYAQSVDRQGKAIGGGGPPTAGLGWDPNNELRQFHIVQGRPPEAADEVVLDKHTANKGNFHVGDVVTVLTTGPPAKYKVVGIAKF